MMPKKRRNRGKKAAQSQSLQDLIREPITEADIPSIRREFIEGTDRSAALVACAILDGALMNALAARMAFTPASDYEKMFFGQMAPLATFSTRIQIGKALAIYGPQTESMFDSIRKIRNVFAHSPKPHPFSHPSIKTELETLPAAEVHLNLSNLVELDLRIDQMTTGRARFLGVCFSLVELLNASAKLHWGKTVRYDIPEWDVPVGRSPLPEIFELLPPAPPRNPD